MNLLKAIPFLLSGIPMLLFYSPAPGTAEKVEKGGTDSLEMRAAIVVDWMTVNLKLNAKESEIAYFELLEHYKRRKKLVEDFDGTKAELDEELADLEEFFHERLRLALTKAQLKEFLASQEEIENEVSAYFAKHDSTP